MHLLRGTDRPEYEQCRRPGVYPQHPAGHVRKGAAVIRLDAFAYAVKKPDTSCFFIEPEMWELLEDIEEVVKPYGVDILPEIHEHYTIQQKIADKGFWVYDFALPMLVLHALYTGKGRNWCTG